MLTEEEVLNGIRRQREAVVWINQQLTQLRWQFGGQYIALKEREVIDSDADFDNLRARVRQRDDKELVTIEFVSEVPSG